MKFTDIFIKRPVLAMVVSLLILLLGLKSAFDLNVRQYPELQNAVVTVATTYVGADADLVQGFITTPLEREIASAQGIDYIKSTSLSGVSSIQAYLRLDYDPNVALTQIAAKVNKLRNQLPEASEDPVVELSVGDTTAAMYLSFYSDILDNNQITDYLVRVVEPKLATVPGVQRAQILGDRTFAMRIWMKPDRMAALGVTASDVYGALGRNNVLAALGTTKGSMVQVDLTASTDLQTPEQFKALVVRSQDDAIIRLGDIADVVLGSENYSTDVSFNGKSATFMGIEVAPDANSLDVIKRVRDEVWPQILAQLPEGLEANIPYDSTRYINDAIKEVIKTLIEAVAIVIVRADSGGDGAAVYDRRLLPHAAHGLLDQPADAAGLRARHRHGGRRRHHRAGEHPSPHRGGAETLRCGDQGCARSGRAGHRHDHHAGRGVSADRFRRRPDRGAVRGVRVHAGRRRAALGHHRADAVAHDVGHAAALAQRGEGQPFRQLAEREVRAHEPGLPAQAQRRARRQARDPDLRCHRAGVVLLPVQDLADRAGAGRGSGLLHDLLDQRLVLVAGLPDLVHQRADQDRQRHSGEGELLPAQRRRRRRFGGGLEHGHLRYRAQALDRAHARHQGSARRDHGQGQRCRRPAERGVRAAVAAQRRQRLPDRVRDHRHGVVAGHARCRRRGAGQGHGEQEVHLHAERPEDRQAAGQGRGRPREGRAAGYRHEHAGGGHVGHALRRLRQPLQHGVALVQGDSAGAARRASEPGPAVAVLHAHGQRRADSAVDRGDPARDGAAAVAEPLPAAQCRDPVGRAASGRDHGRGAGRAGGGGVRTAEGIWRGLRRPVASVQDRRLGADRQLLLRAGHHLPGAGGAVRVLPRPDHHADHGADVDLRGVALPQHRGVLPGARGEHQHLHPGRPGDADRRDLQARHPDRGVRQPAAEAGSRQASRHRGGGGHPSASGADDHGGAGAGHAAAADRYRSGRGLALLHGPGDRHRHDHRHAVHAVRGAGHVPVPGA
ncbi:UNVERIFIED_CONTAM: putative transporter [Trichonephila clavipes]